MTWEPIRWRRSIVFSTMSSPFSVTDTFRSRRSCFVPLLFVKPSRSRLSTARVMAFLDRVPFAVKIDAQSYRGVPNSAAYYDPAAYRKMTRQITVDF